MSDALQLARFYLASVLGPNAPMPHADTLARAVIAQHDELERLRAVLGEALDGWQRSTAPEHDDVHARIAELRRLVMP